jgi:excisionase family DNA binding protein
MNRDAHMLTTKEAAERLQVSEASIRVWLNNAEEKARRFPNAIKFGRDWQIPDSDVDKLPSGRGRGRPPKAKTESGSEVSKKRSKRK